MSDGADPQVRIEATIDPSGATVGGAQVVGTVRQIGDAAGAVQGPLTEAEAAAKKFGTSVAVAQAALDKVKAQDKAMEVTALAAAMREASARTEENAEASKDATAAEDTQAESAERLNAMMREHQQGLMRNAFYVHRLAEGFKDLSMGGRLAGQGLMDVSESLQYMLGPEIAIYSAGLQVAAMLAMIVLGHKHRGEAAREAAGEEKTAAEETKAAWTTANDLLEVSMKRLGENTSYNDLLTQAKAFSQELHLSEDAANSLQAALDRLADAKFGAQEAGLNLREQSELKGKSGEDAEAIRLKYQRERDTLIAAHEQEKAAREVTKQQAELAAIDAQIAAANQQKDAAWSDFQKASQAAQAGTTGASLGASDFQFARDEAARLAQQKADHAAGLADANGKAIPALTPAEVIELQTFLSALPQLRKTEQEQGPQYGEQIKRLNKQRDDLQKEEEGRITDAQAGGFMTAPGQTQQQAIDAATTAIMSEYADKFAKLDALLAAYTQTQDGGKAIDDTRKKAIEVQNETDKVIATLQAKRDAINQGLLPAAKVGVETAGTKGAAEQQKDANAEQAEQAKIARENRDRELEGQLKTLQGQLAAATDDARKAQIQAQIAAAENQQAANKRDDALAGQTTDPASQAATKALFAGETAESAGKLTGEQARDAHAELVKENAAMRAQIAELKKEIDARPDHKALEPFVRAAEAIADPVQEVAALQTIMNTHVATLIELHGKMQAENAKNTTATAQNTRDIEQLKRGSKNNFQ